MTFVIKANIIFRRKSNTFYRESRPDFSRKGAKTQRTQGIVTLNSFQGHIPKVYFHSSLLALSS